jgi:hypothetical protein
MDISYFNEIRILGFYVTSTVNATARRSWYTVTDRIRAQARDAYARELSLDRRIQYVHDYLLAKVWYVVQIFPPPDECIRMLNTSISWFLWKGEIFRVPLSNLQRRKEEGSWDLIHLKAKCLALLLHRTWQQSQNQETFTAAWLNRWSITDRRPNPPHRGGIPAAFEYLRRIHIDYAYVTPHDPTATQRTIKRRLYTTMNTMMRRESGNQDLRIVRQRSDIRWEAVWKNLHHAPVPERYKSEWY